MIMVWVSLAVDGTSVHSKWDEQARATFKTALLQEAEKRYSSIPYISNWTAISALEEVNPGVVEIELDSGKRKYEIPCFKFENSLVKGGIQRGLLTALLDESPLDADSLHGAWKQVGLKESDIFLKTHTRITVWDFQEQPSSAFSKNVQKFSQTDSLLSYYMGFRCEVEATGYASCEWWWLLSDWRLLAIGGVCAGIELLFFIFGKMYCYRKNRQPEEVEQEGLPVIVVTVEQSPVYQVGEHTFFDAERMELIKEEQVVKLTPQTAVLLEKFLQAEGHTLSTSLISETLWPNGSGSQERIHTLIRRLRKSLGELTALQIKFKNDSYHLIIPHFIEKNALTNA
ncbi:MAG: winged helix-turn-helix domain-containing protein [Bacteroides cellulosilyticus]